MFKKIFTGILLAMVAYIAYLFYDMFSVSHQKDLSFQASYETVTKKEYGDKWAFTSDTAQLRCYKSDIANMPIIIIDGEPYGFTGWADQMHGQQSRGKAMENFNNVRLRHPEIKNAYMDYTVFEKRAKSICSKY